MTRDRLNPRWHDSRRVILVDLRRALERAIAAHCEPGTHLRLLDYGCGDCCYRPLFDEVVADYVGADLAGNADADLVLREDGTVPAPDGEFDIVLSTQVLEHVAEVSLYLAECKRLLRPGGLLLLSTHGLWKFHPHPVDLWRWTGSGLEQELRRAGFDVLDQVGLLGLAPAALQLLQDAILELPWVTRLPGVLRAPVWVPLQGLVQLTDALYSPQSRREQASVHLAVARSAPRTP